MSERTPDEILAYAAKATPGPWFQWTLAGDVSSEPEDAIIMRHMDTVRVGGSGGQIVDRATPQANADLEFVCNARVDLPRLAERVKALEAENERLRVLCRKADDMLLDGCRYSVDDGGLEYCGGGQHCELCRQIGRLHKRLREAGGEK